MEAKKSVSTDPENVAVEAVSGVVDLFKALRRKEKPEVLLDSTLKWMAKLPRHVQPRHTGAQFPRIVNKLAELWESADESAEYLLNLVEDRRGGRKGFPPAIAQEIQTLFDYYTNFLEAQKSPNWRTTFVPKPDIKI